MDKNIIKNGVTRKLIKEIADTTPGITVTNAIHKKSGTENKVGLKAIAKDVTTYDKKSKQDSETSKVPRNKMNYEGEDEVEFHEQMEIMNGLIMNQYDRDPSQEFKDRAKEAIVGSSRMGNKGGEGMGNAEAMEGVSSDDFGEKLVKNASSSMKKRQDAAKGVTSFGDDIEMVPKGYAPMTKFSALKEMFNDLLDENLMGLTFEKGDLVNMTNKNSDKAYQATFVDTVDGIHRFKNKAGDWVTTSGMGSNWVLKKANINEVSNEETSPYGSEEEYEFNNSDDAKKPLETDNNFNNSDDAKKPLETDNNKKTKVKEAMKRLKFKKEFNGFGNALKLIPESYKIDNKTFKMTDGNENYTIRWEGTLSEGKAIILKASDNQIVNEDLQRIKHFMHYKSKDTLGLVKGGARLLENKVFDTSYKTIKNLFENENIEGHTAKEGDLNKAVKKAPEAQKHIQGSVSKDKGTKAPAPKTGNMKSLQTVKSQAPEAKKHVQGSVDSKIGMGLGVEAPEGEWSDIDTPQGAAHGTVQSTTYAKTPTTGMWDKISVPQANDAKKHVNMMEKLELNGMIFETMYEEEELATSSGSETEEQILARAVAEIENDPKLPQVVKQIMNDPKAMAELKVLADKINLPLNENADINTQQVAMALSKTLGGLNEEEKVGVGNKIINAGLLGGIVGGTLGHYIIRLPRTDTWTDAVEMVSDKGDLMLITFASAAIAAILASVYYLGKKKQMYEGTE